MFGSFGFIIQIVLGIIAFMVLICKKGLLLCNNINSKTLFRKTKTSLEDLVFRCFEANNICMCCSFTQFTYIIFIIK